MLKNDLILRNPLRLLRNEKDSILPPGGFGAVLARAGVGKTAFMVQLALNTLLRDKNVLHISLVDPVDKVTLWYKEVLNNIASTYKVKQIDQLWESILPHRFIMTFRVEGFSVPKLEERLSDITEQGIFNPQMIIIDGLPFEDESTGDALAGLKEMAKSRGMHVWFAVRTHRHEKPDSEGMPTQITDIVDLFDVVVQLQPQAEEIHVKALKGGPDSADPLPLLLNPSTMLLKINGE